MVVSRVVSLAAKMVSLKADLMVGYSALKMDDNLVGRMAMKMVDSLGIWMVDM